MTRRQHSHLVIWLLLLWDFCDDLFVDSLLCGVAEQESAGALDGIEHELMLLGVDHPRTGRLLHSAAADEHPRLNTGRHSATKSHKRT